ncbi:hemerythrinHHE cation binding domain-containing protein [Colletotrichum musicola]|uniref:HemerythrinHHE cation binding domain-containing protein n=1 Tax=Colletotrichum musicola TaxID=2175873 RepID=A0A8H6MTE0_9PEZI|nr:hemerythrinHHE cation binding domain-containing protein [Colletotrichum musicola]
MAGYLLLVIPSILISLLLSRSPFMMTTIPQTTKPWADGPMKLIPTPQYVTNKTDLFTTGATHMCLLHNSILRGYNSIYHQAAHVQEADKADFIGYSQTWFKFVKSHHDDEEETLFTKVEDLLNDKKVFAETHEEHESFLGGLAEFSKYLSSLSSPSDFSGAKLLEIMKGFQEPFENHFHSEIQTIARLAEHPNAPKEGTPEAANASLTFKTWGKSTVTKAGTADVVPFFLLNLDRTVEDGLWANWPPMPAPIKWGLINIAGAWHWGWWKFASCDAAGQPRELYALQSVASEEDKKSEL